MLYIGLPLNDWEPVAEKRTPPSHKAAVCHRPEPRAAHYEVQSSQTGRAGRQEGGRGIKDRLHKQLITCNKPTLDICGLLDSLQKNNNTGCIIVSFLHAYLQTDTSALVQV